MFENIKSIIATQTESVTNTIFIKDIKKNGIVVASLEGIERERLKLKIKMLEEKYKQNDDLEEILTEYDVFSNDFNYRDIVKNIKKRLIKRALNIDKINRITKPINFNIYKMYFPDFVYVLQLENKKYFVGTNSDDIDEILDNAQINANDFINKHKPIKIISQVRKETKYDEHNTVLEYMSLHGIANVRGGLHQSIAMTENEVNELIKSLMNLNNLTINYSIESNVKLDDTVITTYLMYNYGKFTVEEISCMRNLTNSTISFHLEKCVKLNIEIINKK